MHALKQLMAKLNITGMMVFKTNFISGKKSLLVCW